MAITSSGEIKFSDIQTEFGGSNPIAFSEYYYNASGYVTNSTFPASGEFKLSRFYGASDSVIETVSSNTTNLVLATLFGSAWTSTIPKILNINSGVTVGATSNNVALLVSSSMGGTLVVNNAGTITGYGGTAGASSGNGNSNSGTPGGDGGAGGHAISVASTGATINNTGTISGGGGGGGGGGAGERGRRAYGFSQINVAGYAGGAGGVGAGYNQSATNGSSGSASPWNYVGSGGDGGNGGALGTAGQDGDNGGYTSVVNRAPGAGGDGGAAGAAIANGGATWTNGTTSGTYNGAYT